MKAYQTTLTLDYGISREQACILCHLSSGCGGCCVRCNHDNGCQGQCCSQPTRHIEGQRWGAWMNLVRKYSDIRQCAVKVIPIDLQKKYGMVRPYRNHKNNNNLS